MQSLKAFDDFYLIKIDVDNYRLILEAQYVGSRQVFLLGFCVGKMPFDYHTLCEIKSTEKININDNALFKM